MTSVPDPTGAKPPRGTRSPQSQDSAPKKKSAGGSGRPGSGSKKGSLQEARRRGRMDRSRGEEEMSSQLGKLDLSSSAGPSGTGLVYSDSSTKYCCLWDPSHPECPERVTAAMQMARQEGLVSRCVEVEARSATEEELLLVHKKEFVEMMKSTQTMSQEELKTLSETYDSIFLHPESFRSACVSVGSLLQLVDQVLNGEIRNGFSVARPPGHHAQVDLMNGYSMFNNLAIAARYAKSTHNLERVLIVDWDVHHGQGLQYIFQDDPSVLYFSIHRYEDGRFWPHLVESDSTAVGSGPGTGFNINLPWNQTGMKDADYLAAFLQLLLPVAYEFQPQLVLVAAGFDSVRGDPKGEMAASPQCFSILTHLLHGLAQGRMIMALEGGYNLRSTAEGVCACLRALLGDPCPKLEPPVAPCDSALQSLSRTIAAQYQYWSSLQVLEGGPVPQNPSEPPAVSYGEGEGWCQVAARETGLVYDERMLEHHNMWDSHHPELPQRISSIFNRHRDLGLLDRCLRIPARQATEEELAMCHSEEHIATMRGSAGLKPRELHRLGDEYNSIYISPQSYSSARLAAGACFSAAHALHTGQVSNAVAIVRPPGHHAERGSACGFCFFNSAALTARYAQSLEPGLRVLILDWDVHHGNGTQHIFEDDPSVLYISLHRYDDGLFFPCSEDADYDQVGRGQGRGFNVNIPWSGGRMGDPEYLSAFLWVVMPIAHQFAPGLVLVSAGFDAARGDPLGGYSVTPECYAHMTHLLSSLAGGRLLLILEGGYNLTSISESMSLCTSVLLGDCPPPLPPLPPPHPAAALSINRVLRVHSPHWSSLRVQIPESLRASLPSPKQRGQRSAGGKGKRSVGQEVTPLRRSPRQATPSVTPEPSAASVSPPGAGGAGVQDITAGLLSLDLSPASPSPANHSPASVPVGGARRKVKSIPPEESRTDARGDGSEVTLRPGPEPRGAEETRGGGTQPPNQGTQNALLEEATGWSKPLKDQTIVCEVLCDSQEVGGMFLVEPLTWCPHLQAVNPLPAGGVDVSRPCEECGSEAENWLCLSCYQVLCGRYVNEHMLFHGLQSEHRLVLSLADLSAWCYGCEAYIDNQVLYEVKNAAHRSKFGEDIPCCH
ncbi:histone deacetylase 6 isoform X1 [Amia ocellicauda]|uniref:histone deacetylase 6 isoform X1 n=2 Tax=Amia ocellicauda TaxID=2972642 RepID=UPI003463D0D9